MIFNNNKLKFSKNVLDDLLDELEIFKGTEKFVVRK